MTLKEINRGLVNKEFSCVELVSKHLDVIKKKDKDINAFITVFNDALDKAKAIDKKIANKKKIGVLSGVPIAIKDNILVKDKKCTAGSKILEHYIGSYNATVVDKLGDAVILGKTNLDEFACGASGEYSAFGVTKNPHNLEYVPGGSSSGSAAAVASGMSACALGSDTAGSVRLPASFCGLVGFKPTYGAVSRYGLIAMASSLDQIGVLANTVEDAEIVFDAIKGRDEKDSTSLDIKDGDIKDIVIGIPKQCSKDLSKEMKEILEKRSKDFKTQEIDIPHLGYDVACYYIIMPAEASANLARYDGIKYGSSNKKSDDLMDLYFSTRGKYFGEEVKRRIMLGTYALSSGYYDAYYLRALKVRSKIKQEMELAFEKVDFIMLPTAPDSAFKLGQKMEDPLSLYMMDLLTVPANLSGLPAISLPAGKINDLPVGIQFMGPALADKKLFKLAKLAEELWKQ